MDTKKKAGKRRETKSKWITNETVKHMEHRANLWRVYKDYPSDINYSQYKKDTKSGYKMVRGIRIITGSKSSVASEEVRRSVMVIYRNYKPGLAV